MLLLHDLGSHNFGLAGLAVADAHVDPASGVELLFGATQAGWEYLRPRLCGLRRDDPLWGAIQDLAFRYRALIEAADPVAP